MVNLIYKFARVLITAFFKVFYRMEVYGIENIPPEDRLVVVANHISYYDPVLIGCALNRRVYFMAKEELFKIPVLSFLLRLIGQIPVKRGKPDRTALREAFRILEEEKVLGIFPEGTTRGKSETLRKAKSGAVLIPVQAKSPILPVGIKIEKRKIKLSIGKSFTLEDYYERKLEKEERTAAGDIIMSKIADEIKRL